MGTDNNESLAGEPEYAEDSLGADLAAAWEDSTGEDDGSTDSIDQPVATGDTAADTPATDERDVSVPDDSAVQGGKKSAAKGKAGADAYANPPVGLSAEAREAWKDVPAPVRAAIDKRERDFASGIQQYAENAKRAQAMDNVLAPFGQYLQMNGGPGNAVEGLLRTAVTLQSAPAQQRAQQMAQLIQQFDINIDMLDQYLVGQTPKERPEDAIQAAVRQAVAPYEQQMQYFQQMQQQAAQQRNGQISGEVNNFASSNEFYADVSMDMADLLDMAANRGVNMTMEEAYKKACAINPEVQRVLDTRARQPSARQRLASSSISGSPGGAVGYTGGNDRLADIANAWENVGRT